MNFLPYILLWIFGRASSDNKWNACRNNTYGDEGICLSEGLCVGKGGLNIGTCTSSLAHNICCKLLFVIDNEVNSASSVIPPNIFLSYEESKTDSTFIMEKPVFLDVSHDQQNTVDVDSSDNQLDVFQRNCSSELSQEISTTKLPHKDPNYSSDNFRLSVKLDPKLYLRNHVTLQAKEYLPKPVKKDPTFSPQKSNQEDVPHNQKLHESNPESDLEKLVNGVESRVPKLSIKQKNYDLRNPVQVNVSNYLRKPAQTDFTFNLQKPVQIDSSHNLQKKVLAGLKSNHPKIPKGTTTVNPDWPVIPTVDHDLRNDVRIQPTIDLRKPVQTDITFYLQKPVQVDPSHDLRKVVKVSNSHDLQMSPTQELGHNLRNPDPVRTINILREHVKTDSTFHSRKSVQVDLSHDLREVVRVSDSHDLRWPLTQTSDHDLRNPVQVHATNDLRQPVQTDFTFYLQKPVKVDSSHDLRKAVKVEESHDLRWPIVEEPDHDLRNPDSDIDLFINENLETKLDNIIQEYAKKTSKDGKNRKNHNTIYELLDEDDRIKSNCTHEFWSSNNINSENRTHLENLDMKASHQKLLFRNSTKSCGVPYNESTENLDLISNLAPWKVSLQAYSSGKFRHICGGSLLNNLWVITAAHCVHLRPKWDFLLKLGTENNGESQNYIERLVSKISIHPKYNSINFDSDIALLRMDQPVIFQSNIVPICLPDIHESMEKRKAVVLSWQVANGRNKSSGSAQAETVPVLTNKECEVMFSKTGVIESIGENFLCVGKRSVKESCAGDSGGPLAVLDSRGRWSLAGIYSWGKTCKIQNQPEVYIRVTNYVNWIEGTIACFEHYINLSSMNT